MDPSKEFDKLFQKMKQIERSEEARGTSLEKMQQKVGRKKRHVLPVFISIVMVVVACFFVFTMITPNSTPSDQLAAPVSNDDQNKAAIRAVLEHEFTGPDEEYIRLVKEMHRQQTDPTYEKYVGQDKNPDNTQYMKYLREKFSTYFTEHGFDVFIMSTPAHSYHRLYLKDYKISISTINVVQSENPDAPKNYSFTAQVLYENKDGEEMTFEMEGKAICSEPGKIGKIYFTAHGLSEKMNEDMNE